jgi:hypothetical protein
MCLVAMAVAGCGGNESDPPGAAEQSPTEPATAAPSATESVATQAYPTKRPSPELSPTEADTPTESDDMSQSPESAPPILTDEDDGRSVALALGTETSLRLDSAWFWDEPNIAGDAVELTRVDYFTDPGFMEWIVTARQPGDAVLTATGEPNCDDNSQCPPRSIAIRFRVTG